MGMDLIGSEVDRTDHDGGCDTLGKISDMKPSI